MRLFIAIGFDKDYFLNIQQNIQAKESKLKLTDSFHTTLRFLGDVDNPELIASRLNKIVYGPFKAIISELGAFPDLSNPKVIWVGFKDTSHLMKLKSYIDKSLMPDYEEEKGYIPHITLARVKYIKDKRGFTDDLRSIEVEDKEVEVRSFALYKSTLTPTGAVHEVIASYDL